METKRILFESLSTEEMSALKAGKAEVLNTCQTQPVAGDGAALSCFNKEEPIKQNPTTQPTNP